MTMNADYPPPPGGVPPTSAAWLQSALARLTADGFTIRENVPYGNVAFPIVAHKSQFEVSKFGNYETFYVFARLTPLDVPTMQRFGADAFNCAMQNRRSTLPVGFFEGVCCYTVAITDRLEPAAEQFVRAQEPPKHWAAVEFPVAFDVARQQVCLYEKTPLWGAAYFAGFRNDARRLLG